jgi:glycosyltransferase involved in cell wall biosynthesis
MQSKKTGPIQSEPSFQMSLKHPQVSVVIPHLNQPEGLEACLASLDRQTLDLSCFEVIVVDNGSVSPPHAVLARHPRARLLSEPTPGPGPARNMGVHDAEGHIISFIDADCRAHPDWLSVALQRISAVPSGTVLGGDVRIWRENKQRFTAIEAYESIFAYLFKRYIERQGFSGTGNLVMRREDFDRVGPFRGVQVAEDMDWGRRACTAGLIFQYVPEMIVFHPARRSLGELCIKWDRHLQHYVNMARKKPAWRLRWIVRALAVLISPVVDSFKVFTSDRVHGVTARLKALIVLVAIRAYRAWAMVKLLWSNKGVMWNRDTEVGAPDVE